MSGYTGTFFKGNASNIGAHQIRIKQPYRSNGINGSESKVTFYLLLAIPIIFILLFFYFNRRACNKLKGTPSKAEQTVDMIEQMANYNLTNDINEIDNINAEKHQKYLKMMDDMKKHEILMSQVREKQTQTKIKSLEDISPDLGSNQAFSYITDMNKLPTMQFELQKPMHQINSPYVMPGEIERPSNSDVYPGAFNDDHNDHNNDFMTDLPPMILQSHEMEYNVPYNSPYQYKEPNMVCNNNDYSNGESLSEIIRAYNPNEHTLANEW